MEFIATRPEEDHFITDKHKKIIDFTVKHTNNLEYVVSMLMNHGQIDAFNYLVERFKVHHKDNMDLLWKNVQKEVTFVHKDLLKQRHELDVQSYLLVRWVFGQVKEDEGIQKHPTPDLDEGLFAMMEHIAMCRGEYCSITDEHRKIMDFAVEHMSEDDLNYVIDLAKTNGHTTTVEYLRDSHRNRRLIK